jgi:hypothetical protein
MPLWVSVSQIHFPDVERVEWANKVRPQAGSGGLDFLLARSPDVGTVHRQRSGVSGSYPQDSFTRTGFLKFWVFFF